MFGTGCEVIYLDDKMFRDKLSSAIENAWQTADSVRPQLLDAAVRQIQSGHEAYEKIFNLVGIGQEDRAAVENIK